MCGIYKYANNNKNANEDWTIVVQLHEFNQFPNRTAAFENRTETDPNSEPNRGFKKNQTEFRTEPENVIPHTPIRWYMIGCLICKRRFRQCC